MKYKLVAMVAFAVLIGQFNRVCAEFYTYGLFRDSSEGIISEVALNAISVSIQEHGSYLDITESVTISPMLTMIDEILDFWVEGEVSLPRKSVISQIILSDGVKRYSAKILPLYPESHPVDSTLGEPLVLVSLKKSHIDSIDLYHIRLNKLPLGKNTTVSIRYLVPNTGNAMPVYDLHLICPGGDHKAGFVEFSFKGEENGRFYSLDLGNINYSLYNGQYLQIPYQEKFRLKAVDKVFETVEHITSFEEGDYKGKFLLLNTSVPDTVMLQLSRPIELIFLWRWNKPSSFVKKNSDFSQLTSYGSQAISQAAAISTLLNDVAVTGNQMGMVHSIQYRKPEVFPLCKKNSAAFTVLDGYLGQMDENYFLNSGYYEEEYYPTDPNDTLTDSSRTEFLNGLNIVKGLYSDGAGIMKHLIVVTCGPVRNSSDIITLEELDPLIKDISVDCEGAFWKDVSFANVKGGSLNRELIQIDGFRVPQFRPSSIILQVANSEKKYKFPMSVDQKSFSIIAKSEGVWSPELIWYGFDNNGFPFDTAGSYATVYQSNMDTGLVKLWATNNERISETVESGIGAQYGVISEDYSMRIYPSYESTDSAGYAQAYNYYAKEVGIVKKGRFKDAGKLVCSILNRIMRIALPGNEEIKRIKIYSLSGTLIANLDPVSFKTGAVYSIPLNSLFSSKTSCVVILQIMGKSSCWAQKIWIRN